jgi:hypothetical protein
MLIDRSAVEAHRDLLAAERSTGEGGFMSEGRSYVRAFGFLSLAIALLSLQPAHAQRLQTFVGEARLPVLPLSAPTGAAEQPLNADSALYQPLRIDIGTNVQLPHDPKFYGVTAIAIQEKGDEPCKIELYGRLLDHNESQADLLVGKGTLFGCDEEWTSSWRAATIVAQPHTFINGVQACYPNPPSATKKLKGLIVTSVVLLADGRVTPFPLLPCIDGKTPHCFARPHCGDWANLVMCHSGEVLMGVTVYHYAENNNPPRAISAIQPWCRGVRSGGA